MRHYVLNVYFGLFGIHNAVHPAVPRCTKRLPLTDTLKVRVICSAETQYTCAAYICQQKIKKHCPNGHLTLGQYLSHVRPGVCIPVQLPPL